MKAIIAYTKKIVRDLWDSKARDSNPGQSKALESNWASNIKHISKYFTIFCVIGLIVGLVFPLVLGFAETPAWTSAQISLPEGVNLPTTPTDPLPSTSEVRGAWTTIFSDDFEGTFPGNWTVIDGQEGYGEYYWGQRTCRPYAGTNSAWAVGGGADGSSLACGANYPDNASSWMVYGPFSLEDASDAEFSFKFWLNSENDYDYFYATASINGSNFYGWRWSGNSGGWGEYVFDLTNVPINEDEFVDYSGEPQVWIAFIFISDGSDNFAEGVYVDDFILRKYVSDEPQTYTISASAGANGSISPSGDVEVAHGANQTFTITPDADYQVANVEVDGSPVGAVTEYTFTDVQSNHTIHATFELIPSVTYTITASAGTNGSISPSGNVEVSEGANQTFNITPNTDYQVANVDVDGSTEGAVTEYTFTNVKSDHTIHATFEPIALVTHYAFINQPWDYVEGTADPNANINAILTRGSSQIANTSITSDEEGDFSFHFVDNGNHIDLLVGDVITLSGGGLSETLKLIDISGSINYENNQVQGQAIGGIFPAEGVVSIGQPSDINLTTQTFNFSNTGSFNVDFNGIMDITIDHFAMVDYIDPAGNRVRQRFYPKGLDIRVLTLESRVEGVTKPGEEVAVQVLDSNNEFKASATTSADETGFYSTLVYHNGKKVMLELGDHIEVKNSSRIRSTTLNMYHVSYLDVWNDRIYGNILGVLFPEGSATGRVDIWSASEQKWFTQEIEIDQYGAYSADFSNIVDIDKADIARVWAIMADGNQQALLGFGLHVGASTSIDNIWGYTTAERTVTIKLYQGLINDEPVNLLATQTIETDSIGFFSTKVQSNAKDIDIAPSNVVVVKVGPFEQTLLLGQINTVVNVNENQMIIEGPKNTILHVEGRRREDQYEGSPYQEGYFWIEVPIGEDGKVTIDFSDFGIESYDRFDLNFYNVEQGLVVHMIAATPSDLGLIIYLPLIMR